MLNASEEQSVALSSVTALRRRNHVLICWFKITPLNPCLMTNMTVNHNQTPKLFTTFARSYRPICLIHICHFKDTRDNLKYLIYSVSSGWTIDPERIYLIHLFQGGGLPSTWQWGGGAQQNEMHTTRGQWCNKELEKVLVTSLKNWQRSKSGTRNMGVETGGERSLGGGQKW